jgi:hypothetical protein
LKRPGFWLLGIIGTVATGYFTATLNDLTKPLHGYVSELSCNWRKSSLAADEPKFTILVTRLYKDDTEDSHTRRLFQTFQGERGFRPVLLCDTLRFDFRAGEEIKQAEEATIKRGQDLIVEHKADLLIFGEVVLANNSIRVFGINEHGGCDTRPKPIVLRDGVLPDEFDRDTKMKVLGGYAARDRQRVRQRGIRRLGPIRKTHPEDGSLHRTLGRRTFTRAIHRGRRLLR